MTTAVPDILARIVAHKKAELEQAKRDVAGIGEARVTADSRTGGILPLRYDPEHPAIIAEIKKASPSKGRTDTGFPARRNRDGL